MCKPGAAALLATALLAALGGCGSGSSVRAPGPAACSWHLQRPGPAVDEDLEAVSFPDVTHGWVVGGIGGPVIRSTSDGGTHWRAQHFAGQYGLSGVSFVDNRHGWAVGADNTVIATTDGGATWRAENPHIARAGDVFGVSFIDTRHGWIVGENGLIEETADGGRTWTRLVSGTGDDLDQVIFSDASNGWISTASGRVLRTTDGGASWSVAYAPNAHDNEEVSGLAVLDRQDVWASGSQDQGESNYGAISRTDDGGMSWKHYVATNFDDERFGPVAFTDRLRGWVASPLDGSLWYTDNGGASWGSRASPTANEIHAMTFRGPTHGWAVASSDTILACTP
jgi:photosystem II stability/assembly factor-like uncharacterized protein